jgi:hypothetical protein
MRPLVLYLNEMSCNLGGLGPIEMQFHAIGAVAALQATVRIRSDTSLRLPRPFGQITFGDGMLTFGQLFPGHSDKLILLKRHVDRAPYGPASEIDKEVVYNGTVGIGMSWAHFDASFVLSMGHAAPWSELTICAEEHTLDEIGVFKSAVVHIRNLATPAHAAHWRQEIEDYGGDPARSSLLYRGGQFVIRMHLCDHDPPHIHVYSHPDETRSCLAKIRIDNQDILEGLLPSAVRRDVMGILVQKKEILMAGWSRCRRGLPPLQIQ